MNSKVRVNDMYFFIWVGYMVSVEVIKEKVLVEVIIPPTF